MNSWTRATACALILLFVASCESGIRGNLCLAPLMTPEAATWAYLDDNDPLLARDLEEYLAMRELCK